MRLAAAFIFAAFFGATAHAQTPSRIESVDCAVFSTVATELHADCGYLHAPENRANPNSRTIAIPFLRMRAANAQHAADPLLMMMGGPGARTIPTQLTRPHPVTASRDIIYLEQRGGALAQPALQCTEYASASRPARLGLVGPDALATARIATARTCAERARSAGIDLSGYTSAEIAADIEDLRRLLGYAQFNLYGLSYSGRVMLEVARTHPSSVRAVVLNTPLPAEANYDEFGSANARRSLNMVFEACATDAACAAAYPDLRRQFTEIVAAARRHPLNITIDDTSSPSGQVAVRATAWVLVNALSDQLYDKSSIERLPRRINAIAHGDLSALREIVSTDGAGYAWMMRIAVWCNEEYPFENRDSIRRQRTDYPEFAGVDQSTLPIGACEAAGFPAQGRAQDSERVASDTPTLIFSGAFDPATPPAWQSAMTRALPASRLVLFPWSSHSAGSGRCGWEMTLSFLDNPQAPLGATCTVTPDRLNFELPAAP